MVAILQQQNEPTRADFHDAISAHPNGAGTRLLQDVVRSALDRKNREEAVFWLAQSDDDAAFEFLDALLSYED